MHIVASATARRLLNLTIIVSIILLVAAVVCMIAALWPHA